MTQEFVTLPREVVEQAIEALFCTDSEEGSAAYENELEAVKKLRAALEHQQNHVPDAGNMVPAGWKLVPVEPTEKMVDMGRGLSSFPNGVYRAMLSAAPQPPTTEQSSAVEQPQGEQEPVVLLADAIRSEPTELIHKWRVLELVQDHARQQPRRELMDNEARRIYNEATYHASIAVFMTRMDAEHQDADDKGVSGWLQEAEYRVKRRITEREPLTDAAIEAAFKAWHYKHGNNTQGIRWVDDLLRSCWKAAIEHIHGIGGEA